LEEQGVDVDQVIIPIVVGNLVLAGALVWLIVHLRSQVQTVATAVNQGLPGHIDNLRGGLEEKFRSATIDMAARLADTKGDLRQQTADRLNAGFGELRNTLERQLSAGREEQAKALKLEIGDLSRQTRENLDAIRGEVDKKLLAISDQVTDKLDQNIKEGFKQFEKVQEHLRAAEEQLRNVSMVGNSINDLNNLLKLPHLRGRFGEASLERLLEDFLPASMYELQAAAGVNGQGRADAVIKFPERVLPIDAKFPREQVLGLFESSDPVQLTAAREQFCRVMKEQGRRIAGYIHPENGTTDMALMYLPSETLYMEAVLSKEVSEWLNKLHVFPVSPNTLIVTLQAIQMVFRMYEFAKSYERATEELQKAQVAFGHFEKQFDRVGSSLDNAQQAWEVARNHLHRYRNRVTNLTGELPPELSNGQGGSEGELGAK
jgi:DNA recombination protein RmuC